MKKLVKTQLWGWGLHVNDVGEIPGVEYDLLVEDKIRVKVIESWKKTAESIRTFRNCDVLAVIVYGNPPDKLYSKGLQGKNGDVTFSQYTESAMQIFPKPA